MSQNKNKKLCHHCEGEIDKDALYCIFCGVDLGSNGLYGQVDAVPEPLYRHKGEEAFFDENQEKSHLDDSYVKPLFKQAQPQEEVFAVEESKGEPLSLFAMPFLMVGSLLFVFSLFLLFFSEDGYLTLKWDASFWFVYLLVSVPVIILGFKYSKNRSSSNLEE